MKQCVKASGNTGAQMSKRTRTGPGLDQDWTGEWTGEWGKAGTDKDMQSPIHSLIQHTALFTVRDLLRLLALFI